MIDQLRNEICGFWFCCYLYDKNEIVAMIQCLKHPRYLVDMCDDDSDDTNKALNRFVPIQVHSYHNILNNELILVVMYNMVVRKHSYSDITLLILQWAFHSLKSIARWSKQGNISWINAVLSWYILDIKINA